MAKNLGNLFIDAESGLVDVNTAHTLNVQGNSGTTIRFFLNGTLQVIGTDFPMVNTANDLTIGDDKHYGYVENFRMVKGTALWTTSFTLSDQDLLYT